MLYNKTCVTGHAIRVNDLFANFHAFAKTGDSGPLCKTIIAGSILFEAFESRNKELWNKNCSYRPMKGELKHILYKNINIYRILAAEQSISIRSIHTLFFGHSNTWNHMFQKFL